MIYRIEKIQNLGRTMALWLRRWKFIELYNLQRLGAWDQCFMNLLY